MKRTTKQLASRREELETELAEVKREIASRAGETDDATNPPPDPQPDPDVDPETGRAVEARTATAKPATKRS